MSGGRGCDNCGSTTENESLCLCDGCEQESQLANDAAKAAARAAGYAEAVGDIRQRLVLECKAARGERKRTRCNEYSRLIGLLDIGAHVGAAKKGG